MKFSFLWDEKKIIANNNFCKEEKYQTCTQYSNTEKHKIGLKTKIILYVSLTEYTLDNLDNVLISRDITFPTKVYVVKAMIFQIVM